MRIKHPLSLAVSMAVLSAGTLSFSNVALAQGSEVDELMEEVTVTGSRIQKTNLISSSPVVQVDADDFLYRGITRVEDLINDLPQASATQTSGIANGSTGTAVLDLRGLGQERTLVLIDGRRLPPGSPISDGIGADINQIPASLVKRAEVLTGGASAAYGSDAVAGVVNFIMVDDFEGVRLDIQNSVYHHDNDNGRLQGFARDRGFDTPNGSVTDGDTIDISFIIGGNIGDGRGNITAYATYREIDPVLQADRDYSACSLDGAPDSFVCGGSSTIPQGRFTDFGALNGDDTSGYDLILDGNEFADRNGELFNFGPLNYFQRPDERYTAGVFANFELNQNAEVYTQMMFMDTRTNAQIAPSGAFFVTDDLNCGNPFLSDQQFQRICGDFGLTRDDRVSDIVVTRTNPVTMEETESRGSIAIGRRNVEGGPRNDDIRHTSFRGVFGIRGEINDNWAYDFYGQYSEVSLEQTYNNDLSITRIRRALDVVLDPDPESDTFDQPVCQSVVDGSDPNCVPWNIFQEGQVTQAALDYLVLPLFARGTTDQKVFSGYVTGNLGDYGLKLPAAERGVDVVVGLEYRSENLTYEPDQGYLSGDGAGQGGPTLGVDGGIDVKEFFLETSVPIIEGKRFAEALTLDLGYRYSDYSTDETTNTYKVATAWTPSVDLRFRASFQRAVRHPNIRELFRPSGIELFDMANDPCAGEVVNNRIGTRKVDEDNGAVFYEFNPNGRTLEECVRSGVTPGQFGNISRSPAGQYNEVRGGSPDLEPEESDTVSVGFIYSPEFVEGLNLSIDYFDIDVENAIDNIGSEFTLNQCLDTGDAEFCDRIRRGETTGTLWIGEDAIISPDVNIGFFNVEGFDINVDYEFDISDYGSVNINYVATYLTTWDREDVPGQPVVDCVGKWGATCENPKPELAHNMRATWFTPWDVTLSGSWRHIGAVDDLGENEADFDSQDYFDLAALWNITDQTQLRLGVNNVFDKEPPLTADAGPSIYGNGNTFPGTYDALGRYMFLGLNVGF
ncbi:TonB-dependent receptor [Exilibacterium tricleocarpae]|uniref:TonB-dependent receptor n=1 Tax=Exilibacterium tricleocarpae TaxID=2591008 RepID=A0A545U3R7_9GAMM|nr:TonB-dependent receptor [Exilibacterium tricleocarpae]TQV84096.1 TonB-dependent receptor [Exilibacterium tricleocarpae]